MVVVQVAHLQLTTCLQKPAAPVTVTAAPKNAPEYVLVASVPALFHLNPATGGYESKSNAQVGCVIVGSGAAYQLLFYDTSKVTLTSTQITAEVMHKSYASTYYSEPVHRITVADEFRIPA